MSASAHSAPWKKGSNIVEDSTVIRAIIIANYLLLVLLFWPPVSSAAQQAALGFLRRTGTSDLVSGALDLWTLGSTLLATILFIRRAVATARATLRPLAAQRGLVVDGVLLVAWCLTLLGILAYGYMVGMGG